MPHPRQAARTPQAGTPGPVWRCPRAGLGALLAATALGLQAAPVSYGYAGTFTSGPFLGQSLAGHFSFDDSLATPNAIHQGSGVISALSFGFEGVDYDETDAPLAGLIFDAAGSLSGFLFGNHCALTNTFTCSAGPNLPGSWFVARSVIAYTGLNAQPGDPTISFALNPVWGPSAAVPEPDTLALLLAALAALPLARRVRASRSRRRGAATS